MNYQIKAVRTDGIKKDSALKDTEKFLLIKIIDYKDGFNEADAVEKIWMDEHSHLWSSYHLNCDIDESKMKFRITNKHLVAEYLGEFDKNARNKREGL